MPQEKTWYCGHCGFGPMSIRYESHCSICGKQKDGYSTVETHHVSSGRRLNTGDSPSPSLGGLLPSRSTFDYPPYGTYGRAAPADFSYDYHGTSGVTSYGESSPTMYRSSLINEIPQGGYEPVTHGSRSWYCCQCRDGPYGLEVNLKCPKDTCQHTRCGYCHVD